MLDLSLLKHSKKHEKEQVNQTLIGDPRETVIEENIKDYEEEQDFPNDKEKRGI